MTQPIDENLVYEKIREITDHWKALQTALRSHQEEKAFERLPSLYKAMTDALGMIKDDYSPSILNKKIPEFFHDKALADEFLATRPDVRSDKFLSFLRRLKYEIAVVENEAKHVYLSPKKIHFALLGGAAALVLLLTVSLITLFSRIKHSTATPVPVVSAAPLPIGDSGLVGEYFADRELGSIFKKRRDKEINFLWRDGSPFEGFPSDNFSVRWTGYLAVETTGLYEFLTCADDGVRLWIDDKPVIDGWSVNRLHFDSGKMRLGKGYHRIKLEYFDGRGMAAIQLYWRRESESTPQIIPQSQFRTKLDL